VTARRATPRDDKINMQSKATAMYKELNIASAAARPSARAPQQTHNM